MNPIVTGEWLQTHRDEVVLADVRWYLDGREGRAEFERGHLPGAVFVDLDHALAGPASPAAGRHPLPDPEAFAAAMGELGIGDGDCVVAYDDQGGVIAARLVWMLRATGHDAALLDGGISAYGGELERGPGGRAPAAFTPRPFPPELLAELDEAAHPRHETVIDARQPERYRGEEEPLDPRAGHIPGALSIPCRANLDERLRFLPVEALRARFSEAGIADAAEVISYCGSGITACHNLLAMEHAGLGRGRLFPGSWSQYSRDQRRPVATGAQPGEPQ